MEEKIKKILATVKYPGFDKDIMALGMVDQVAGTDSKVVVSMKPMTAAGGTREKLTAAITAAFAKEGLQCEVRYSDPHQQQAGGQAPPRREPSPKREIPGVRHIVPVASGKGGVGKSTVSVNLAVALAKAGHSVGLLDLDAYGPSIPTMLGLSGQHRIGSDEKIVPMEKYGIKVVSVGLFLEKGMPLIWRGPMVAKLVKQLFYDVNWGELDILVLDLPPGTGDVQLTMVQSVPITGAVVVTTPQDVALADAAKAVNMFNQTDTKVLGLVENMSFFVCPNCKHESDIFGRGGGRKESERIDVPFLGEIPLEAIITDTGDSGEPIALAANGIADTFKDIARRVADELRQVSPKMAGQSS